MREKYSQSMRPAYMAKISEAQNDYEFYEKLEVLLTHYHSNFLLIIQNNTNFELKKGETKNRGLSRKGHSGTDSHSSNNVKQCSRCCCRC